MIFVPDPPVHEYGGERSLQDVVRVDGQTQTVVVQCQVVLRVQPVRRGKLLRSLREQTKLHERVAENCVQERDVTCVYLGKIQTYDLVDDYCNILETFY